MKLQIPCLLGLPFLVLLLVLVFAGGAVAQGPPGGNGEDPAARRLYDEAQRRMATDVEGAIGELELLVRQFPGDRLAPKALLELARLRRAGGGTDAAQRISQRLLDEYPRSREAASAFVLQAELAVDRAADLEALGEARTTFRRVPLLFGRDTYPDLDARTLALVRSAEIGLVLGDFDGATAELVQAIEDEPPSRVSGRARLVLGRALLRRSLSDTGRGDAGVAPWVQALEVLQTLVDDVPVDADGVPDPAGDGATSTVDDRLAARRLVTLGHRQLLRPAAVESRWPGVQRFASGLALDEPVSVAAAEDGRLLVVDEDEENAALWRPGDRAWSRRPLEDPVRAGFTPAGVAYVVTEEAIHLPFEGQRFTFLEPVAGKEKPLDKLRAAVRGRLGTWYVLAKGWDGILSYASSRRGNELMAALRAEFVDLETDDLGRVLALDEKEDRVVRLSLDARQADTLLVDQRWKKPAALAVDGLGQIYVLDRGLGQIFLYDDGGRTLATLGPDLGGGIELRSPEDLAVDGSGRVYVVDPKQSFVIVLD